MHIEDVPEHMKPARTLVRLCAIENDTVSATIMAWKPGQVVTIPLERFPLPMQSDLRPGSYVIASVNIGAEKAEDLVFSDIAPSPGPLDESRIIYDEGAHAKPVCGNA